MVPSLRSFLFEGISSSSRQHIITFSERVCILNFWADSFRVLIGRARNLERILHRIKEFAQHDGISVECGCCRPVVVVESW